MSFGLCFEVELLDAGGVFLYRLVCCFLILFCQMGVGCTGDVLGDGYNSVSVRCSPVDSVSDSRSFVRKAAVYPLDIMHSACIRLVKSPSVVFLGFVAWVSTLFSGGLAQTEPGLFVGQPEYLACNFYKGDCEAFVSRDADFVAVYGVDAESDIFCENLFDETRCEQLITQFDGDDVIQECFDGVVFDQLASGEAIDICQRHECSEAYLALGTSLGGTSFLECGVCPTDNRSFHFVYKPGGGKP